MSNTVNNGIPFVPENTIDPAAGLNISLNTIDALLQLLVLTVGANTPPGSPVSGDRHIVGTSPTGAWSGQANKLARWLDGAWTFFDARYAVNAADGLLYIRSGATWAAGVGLTGASLEWSTYGGTANAITLTPLVARSAYVTGDKVRFRATSTNTGATTINVSGLGVKNCVTVTGSALPSGYIRTGVDTEAVYDGTNFVVRRLIERGSNANGEYTRWEDGTQECAYTDSTVVTTSTAAGSIFHSLSVNYTFPAAFSAVPKVTACAVRLSGVVGAFQPISTSTTQSGSLGAIGATNSATANHSYIALGRWYA